MCKGVHYVDLGESFPTHVYLQNLASIPPRTSPVQSRWADRRAHHTHLRWRWASRWALSLSDARLAESESWAVLMTGEWGGGVKMATLAKCCKNFVLGCIKTKFCKKICVWQHFSRSTRFASFCTAAISKFSQKIGLKNQHFLWNFNNKNCKCCKICKILTNFKNVSLVIW